MGVLREAGDLASQSIHFGSRFDVWYRAAPNDRPFPLSFAAIPLARIFNLKAEQLGP